MQVGCKQCGATYEFDAAAIPAAGYDAQCTNCGSVFFVAPEAPVEPQISVACASCGAIYQFAASAIPAGGYDAQCTQCQNVFFVSPTGGAPAPAGEMPAAPVSVASAAAPAGEVPAAPVSVASAAAPAGEVPAPSDAVAEQTPSPAVPEPVTEPAPATAAPVASGSESVAASMQEPFAAPALDADAPVELGVPKTSAPIADEPTPLGPPKSLPEGVDPELAEMMALAADLGEPAPSPTGASLEEDFEHIMARKRKRRLILLVVLAVAAAYVAVTYVAVPRLFDLTAGKLVGIKLTVHPDAKPHVAKGVEIMYADTAAAYAEAIVQFEAALAVDPEYPRAVALAGLAHVFRGSDVQERGREVYGEGSAAVAESKALEDLPRSRRTREVEKRITALHETAREKSDESSRLFEAGGKEVSAGYAMLQRGLEQYRDVPVVVEAAGIYYTTDRDAVRRAEECLRYAVETRYGPDQKLNLRDPPDVWAPFLQGLVHAQGRDKDGPNRAREAFEAVLETEPRFQRARYELIRVFDRTGAKAEARALAKEILAAVPEHEKAKRYLARSVEPSGVATAAPPAPAPPKPAKGKKRKKRRR